MNKWLYDNLPGKKSHTPDRWKKLNDAFGEGWEADFGKGAHESQLEAKWDARLVQVKAWVVRHHRYPVYGKNPVEKSLYDWLHQNLPGKKQGSYTPARWKKLNGAFGEGWEADFETRSPSHREAKWDARLAEVKVWVVRHGRYPSSRKTSAETSMYEWLRRNLPGKKKGRYTPARWKKLNDAFGEGWEADFTSRRLSTPSALHRR
jgi:hypothetical protein